MRSSLRHLRRFFIALPTTPFVRGLLAGFVFARTGFALSLRDRSLERNLQLLDSRMGKDHSIVPQQVIRMNFIATNNLETVNVACAQLEITILLLRRLDDQNRRVDLERIQSLAEFLRLRLFQIE